MILITLVAALVVSAAMAVVVMILMKSINEAEVLCRGVNSSQTVETIRKERATVCGSCFADFRCHRIIFLFFSVFFFLLLFYPL